MSNIVNISEKLSVHNKIDSLIINDNERYIYKTTKNLIPQVILLIVNRG